jgi:hypothetical protein
LFYSYIIIYILINLIDNATRWSSTYNMLNNFLNLREPIEIVIATSKAKVFKDKENIRLKEEDYLVLKTYKDIFKVFIKATKKLQGKDYPTLYYSLPLINQIFQQLNSIKEQNSIVSIKINSYFKYTY